MRYRLAIPTALATLALASLALAFSSGPPDGRTGAPGESTCQAGCHNSFALNSGDGSVTISGPSSYTPGDTIDLQIGVQTPDQQRWGFEITALDATDLGAGELLVVNATRTQKSTSSGREYVKQTSSGTDFGTVDQAPGWTVRWVANNGVTGPVTFYAAGNAANGDGGNKNDFIYTTNFTVTEGTTSCCVGIRGNVDADSQEIVDVGDITFLVDFLFLGGPAPVCTEEANVDADSQGIVDVGDITFLVDFLFLGGPQPSGCP